MALDKRFGYGEVEMNGSTGARSGQSGMGSLGSMGSIASDNPTVQWFRANFGADLTEQEINGLITDITRAVQNGLPPERIPQITNLPPSAIENLYDTIAAQQGKSADAIREAYEQQRAADMATLQGLGGGIVAAATGTALAGVNPANKQKLISMNADAQDQTLHAGRELLHGTSQMQHASTAVLGTLARPNTPDVARDRGLGAGAALA